MYTFTANPSLENSDRHTDTMIIFGSDQYISAYTVYEKYKRSENLTQTDLQKIITRMIVYSYTRQTEGKKVILDILIQEASKFIKQLVNNKKNIEEADYF